MYPQSYLNRKDLVNLNLKTNFFIQMKFIAALLGAINAVSVQGDYESVEHTHVEHGTEQQTRDIEVLYDETTYDIQTRTETEVRTRQVPVTTSCEHVETRY